MDGRKAELLARIEKDRELLMGFLREFILKHRIASTEDIDYGA